MPQPGPGMQQTQVSAMPNAAMATPGNMQMMPGVPGVGVRFQQQRQVCASMPPTSTLKEWDFNLTGPSVCHLAMVHISPFLSWDLN